MATECTITLKNIKLDFRGGEGGSNFFKAKYGS